MLFKTTPALGSKLARHSAGALILASVLVAGAPTLVSAQDAAAVAFPPTQARAGATAYAENCATCHGDRLDGQQDAPPLAGSGFQSHFWGQPLSSLYDYISMYMPQDRPGALTPEQYADITAFILSKNGIDGTDGAEKLPGDSAALAAITLPAAP